MNFLPDDVGDEMGVVQLFTLDTSLLKPLAADE